MTEHLLIPWTVPETALSYRVLGGWAADLSERFETLSQARKVHKNRGAWKRKALAGSARDLDRALLVSYHRLEREIVASLHGPSDDVIAGRIQAAKTPEQLALEYYGVDEDAVDVPIDTDRLAAVLLLLALWRTRHTAIADEAAGRLFDIGRAKVLADLGLKSAHPAADTSALRDQIIDRYRDDIERLRSGLENGTARSQGITVIVTGSQTLGEAAMKLRALFDQEGFRVEMLAESLVWTAWLQGMRAGAVDATAQMVRDGVAESDLPRWRWSGPLDEKTCSKCEELFGEPVVAMSLSELVLPQEWCLYGPSCRHWWSMEG